MNRNDIHTDNTSSSELTHRQKYRGLLKRSPLKNIRDDLFRYIDYIYTMASSHKYFTDIFRLIIFAQQCILSFLPFNKVLWPPNTLLGRIAAVFSVISFICPAHVSSFDHFIVLVLIYAFLLLFFIIFFSNLYMFLKMSKVHTFFVSLISIFLNILQPYFINAVASHIGRDLHFIIMNDYRAAHIVTFLFGIIFLVLMAFFQILFVSSSLTFRPQSVHLLYSRYSAIYFCSKIAIFFFVTLGALTSGVAGSILCYLAIIPTLLIGWLTLNQAIWAHIQTMYTLQSFSILFLALLLILPTLSLKHIQGNEIIILCFIAVLCILIFFLEKYSEYSNKKYMDLLNDVSNDEELVNQVSYNQILGMLRFGFDNGHKMCHTWRLFDLALKRFPNDYKIILMYAKYAAIYSEESCALQLITRTIRSNKHGSVEFKHVLFQINSLLQHRERGLSKSLKKTISKIMDKTEKCRGQMRYTWECVIRGNVAELENLSTQLKKNEDEILREYAQLSLVYPNNPYVASAYSAFLLDIVCNEKEASNIQKIYRLLRSGARTRTERSYYFAIRHIPTLPTEEQHALMIRTEKPVYNENQSYASSVATIGLIGDLADQQSEAKTQKRYIESMVNAVKLPSTRYGSILTLFSIAILMPVIIIPELIYSHIQMQNNEKSLQIIKSVSLVNLYMAHTTFYAFQYAMSANDFTRTLSEKWNAIYPTSYFGGAQLSYDEDDRHALINAIEDLRSVLDSLNKEIPGLAAAGHFSEPLNYIFSDRMISRNYINSHNFTDLNVSIEHIVTHHAANAFQTATSANISNIFNFGGFWTLIKNEPLFAIQYESFERLMIESMQVMLYSSSKYIETFVEASLIPGLFISLFLIIFLTVKMEKEKHQLFRSFKALPKSAVSAIVQQLNAQSGKDNQDNEASAVQANPQEENALRILSTSVDHGFGWLGRSWLIIVIMIIFTAASIVAIIVLNTVPSSNCVDLIRLCPLYHDLSIIHINFMIGLVLLNRNGMLYNATDSGLNLFKNTFDSKTYPDNYSENWATASSILSTVMDYAYELRFGNLSTRSLGLSMVGPNLINLLSSHSADSNVTPESDIEILEICSYDTSIEYISKILNHIMVNMELEGSAANNQKKYGYYDLDADEFALVAVWLISKSFSEFIEPSFYTLDSFIEDKSNNARSVLLLAPVIICTIIIFVCGVILIPIYQHNGETAQWTLRLLLFCNPNVVLQSKAILKILSNDFSSNDNEENEEKSSFYESIVSHLLDGVLFLSNDLTIRNANNAVATILNCDLEKIIGISLKELFTPPPGEEASLKSFLQAVYGAMNSMRPPSIECEIEVMKGNEPVTLQVSMTAISATGEVQLKPVNSEGLALIVLSMKDLTATTLSRKLLIEENLKNENLLSLIIPHPIVKQIQRGDKNICFSVQSASILFADIVQFTPWCESHTPVEVMTYLNKLFESFDENVKKYERMTKIKCIGDSYMCAGGVFDEVNQQSEHAKQAISLGVDLIACIRNINRELKYNLTLKVGCNTGGPVVAGVLGIDKPTFDILGPDIYIALVMTREGVPMNVHIPQHVYELIYSEDFIIKEKGDTEIKGKSYHTYLVSGHGHTPH